MDGKDLDYFVQFMFPFDNARLSFSFAVALPTRIGNSLYLGEKTRYTIWHILHTLFCLARILSESIL